MKDIKKLLDVRARAKARKPTFRRQDWHIRKKFGEMWRQPRGQHSKMRLKVAGRGALVKPGYGSPRLVRGLSKDGKQIVHATSSRDFEKMDAKKQTAIIAASVGAKKRIALMKLALQKGIALYNVKNPEVSVKNMESAFSERKKRRVATEAKKGETKKEESKKESKDAKKESKERQEEELSEEEKQRREAEKVMIQR